MSNFENKLKQKLHFIYEDENIDIAKLEKEILSLVKKAKVENKSKEKQSNLTSKDVFLITYGDAITNKKEKTFLTFRTFANKYLKSIPNVHFLPMFPYTSDDGFSVVDYYNINPTFGTWKDLKDISNDGFNLMYDDVANHMSSKSEWFKKYLKGEKPYDEYFTQGDLTKDYSYVTRPRVSPLIHEYKVNAKTTKTAWTTFSEDQVDLNYKSPKVLLESIKILFYYFQNGAKYIRLDAIGFIWKEENHPSIHHPKAHEIIKLWRLITDEVYKNKYLISETNVPHKENISYFGNGDEVSMVYNFALPPLVLHTFLNSDSKKLTTWAKSLGQETMPNTTYFNFLSSHDGIGMRPVEKILNDDERSKIVESVLSKKGLVSFKTNSDGTKSVYELNIVYFDAVTKLEDSQELQIKNFIAAENILLSFMGVPAIYYHSLLGSRGWHEGVKISGINRRINREKLDLKTVEKDINNKETERSIVYNALIKLIDVRAKSKAFNPSSKQEVLDWGKNVFVNKRFTETEEVICVTNITNKVVKLNKKIKGIDLITKTKIEEIKSLQPYEFIWLEVKK